jgi:6-phosphogluconolactonase
MMMNNANINAAHSGVLYIGSYGAAEESTIQVCSFDAEAGELKIVQGVAGLENASYLTLHPDGRSLYAVSEISGTEGSAGGAAAAYELDGTAGLVDGIYNRSLTHGAHPCYVSLNDEGNALFVANYSGGNVALLPIDEDGRLEEAAAVLAHEGSLGPNAARQDGPHAHCITQIPGTPFVCAADLGLDEIIVYKHDAALRTLVKHGACQVQRGAGPRHIVFHPALPIGYVMNELDSTITLLQVDREQGALAAGKAVSALPADFSGYSDAADIHIAPSGRFLYSSTRGHNSIAVLAIDQTSGALSLVQIIGCGGDWPRNFAIAPNGGHLLVANERSNGDRT